MFIHQNYALSLEHTVILLFKQHLIVTIGLHPKRVNPEVLALFPLGGNIKSNGLMILDFFRLCAHTTLSVAAPPYDAVIYRNQF